jgi:hypothetical protein
MSAQPKVLKGGTARPLTLLIVAWVASEAHASSPDESAVGISREPEIRQGNQFVREAADEPFERDLRACGHAVFWSRAFVRVSEGFWDECT